LFDGSGSESTALLQFEPSGQAFALITSTQSIDRELPWHITLVQGIASQDRMDWVIEKAVEIGVTDFVPLLADRSVVKLSEDRAQKRLAHWQKLIISASEQCGRNRLMEIQVPCGMDEAIRHCNNNPILWCHANADTVSIGDQGVIQTVAAANHACLVVGPEGGFSDNEARHWQAAGAQAISLGARILRTETAGLAAIASLNALLEQHRLSKTNA
ncbi:MAG TPA: 16S rRNA (uracil(1498)-N(3))-methyltransferase, partial [Orrella sp.]